MLKHRLPDAECMRLRTRGLVGLAFIAIGLTPPLVEAAVCSVNASGGTECPILGTVFSATLVAHTTLANAPITVKTDAESASITVSGHDVILASGGESVRFHPDNSVVQVRRDGVLVTEIAGGELVPEYRFAQLFGAATAPTLATGCTAQTAWEAVFAHIRPGAVPSAPETSLILNTTYRKHQFLSTEGPLHYLDSRLVQGNPNVGHGEDAWTYLNTDHYHIHYELRLGADVLDSWSPTIYNSVSTCV